MKKIFLILYLFINFYAVSQNNWEQIIIPDSITLKDIAFDSSGNHFLSTSHGVYFSQNGEQWEWQGVNDYLGVITINNRNTIYTASGTLYRSFDNGLTWDSLFYSSQGGITSIFSVDDETIIIGTWGSIYRSTDGGESWDIVMETLYSEVIKDIDENSDGVLFAGSTSYIGGSTPGGIYRSVDSGANWNLIGLEYYFVSSLEINSYDTIFVGTRGHWSSGGGGIFKSVDAMGNAWETIYQNNLIADMDINEYNTLFIGCAQEGYEGGVFCSYDVGDTWIDISGDLPTRYINKVTISPYNILYIITYSQNELFRLNDTITGVHNNHDKKLRIYPNPAKSRIVLKLPQISKYKMELTDLNGRIIKRNSFGGKDYNYYMDISNLKNGIYIIKIYNRENCFTQKLIK